ncbi:MAG: putative peptidoglycan glycosyltransferase FtsW [Candidatus Paceibacterota bacterium]
MNNNKLDKIFLSIVASLVIIGVIMFVSASLGILNKNVAKFNGVMISQLIYGLFGGLVVFYFGLKIPYKFWRRYSLPIFIASIIITTLVFVPGLGFEHGGSKRWINIFGFSLQPVEFLKIGFIIYFAAWLSWVKGRVKDPRFSLLPLIVLLGIIAAILINQPDMKSVILITATAIVMLFISGTPYKYILGLFLVATVALVIFAFTTPYLESRINTFMHPNENATTSSWQIQKSLIAIGSGGLVGKGLGQSVLKFSYLPEPQGDSIFAVVGEEVGFIGSVFIIFLYVVFALRGFRIAHFAPDSFSKILVIGIITMITAQSFLNIASIIGVFPLTGVPLAFMSQGGTALLIDIGLMGIVLNISKFQKKI